MRRKHLRSVASSLQAIPATQRSSIGDRAFVVASLRYQIRQVQIVTCTRYRPVWTALVDGPEAR